MTESSQISTGEKLARGRMKTLAEWDAALKKDAEGGSSASSDEEEEACGADGSVNLKTALKNAPKVVEAMARNVDRSLVPDHLLDAHDKAAQAHVPWKPPRKLKTTRSAPPP